MAERKTDDSTTRREVLTTLAACGCCVALPAIAGAAPEDRVPPAKPGKYDLGAVGDFAKDGIYDQHARTSCVLIVRDSGKVYVTTSICSHKRCILKKKDESTTKCPCHQSEFDTAGIPMGGPAKVPLARFAVLIEDDRLIVDTGKSFAEKDWGAAEASVTVS